MYKRFLLVILLVILRSQNAFIPPLLPCGDNFPYRKYNLLVMQLRNFKKYFKNKKESAFIMKKQTK